ncbi:MFS general substrate transporter [Xylariomycetidae sp. FL2044]|nr:MFS general substrate transporter [Xylariomycetidae sp. FL2044]
MDLEKANAVETYERAHVFLTKPMSVAHELAFFVVVATANFTPHSGFHQTLSILHIIGDSLNITTPGPLVWLVAGYGLTVGTFILPAGRLGDLFGYKKLFILGNIWFAIASLLAGLAILVPTSSPSDDDGGGGATNYRYVVFLFARLMQGIGPALMIPNAVALLGVTYVPGPRKAMLFAIFGALAPASAIASPLFTALFTLAWWPCAFWSLGLLLILIAIAGVYAIPDGLQPPKHGDPNMTYPPGIIVCSPQPNLGYRFGALSRRAEDLDLAGALTGVSGLILISVAWTQGALDSWQRAYVWTLLGLGLVLCAAFVQVERRALKPLVPLEAINSGVVFVLAAVFCGWACFGIYIYYVWEFYEVLRGASPLLATAWHSPILVSGVLAAVTTGLVIRRVGPAVVMALALLAFTAGAALIATAPLRQTYWAQTFLCNVVITWGMDLSFPAATLMLSDLVASEHQGIAASLVTTVVNYSGALALGVAGTVEFRVNNGGATPEDVLRGYRAAWYVGLGLGAVGLVASLVFAWRFSKRQRKAAADSSSEI